MINPGLDVNKTLRSQVEKCMLTTFGAITQPFIRATLFKKTIIVLALKLFMIQEQKRLLYRVLSCVINQKLCLY